ncbi:MAG TPA: outer membrane beta-barrel protein [Thermoanaerobaculia bacterium]|nr:outer membrane beta-barrel protein [Thermoanaerobaculia bacterium]
MRKSFVVLVLLLIPASLFAQDWRNRRAPRDRYGYGSLENKFELTPFVGYTWGGTIYSSQNSVFNQDVDAASSANIGVDFSIPLRQGFKLELMASHQNTDLQNGGGGLFTPNNKVASIDINYYQAGVQIPFNTGRNVYPFVIVTAGVANLSPNISGATSATRFAMSAGGGVKVPINPNMGFRFDIRGYVTNVGRDNGCNYCGDYGYSDTFYQGQANFGVFFSF